MSKYLVFALSLMLFMGCSSEPRSKSSETPDTSPDAQHRRSENDRVDVGECADCHPDEAAAWSSQPMGRSISKSASQSVQPGVRNTVVHPKTQERFTVRLEGGRLVFEGPNDLLRSADWTIGSGAHTHSFATEIHGGLRMLPITWYTSKQSWQMSPGYETEKHPGAHRAVNTECLYCHSRRAPQVPGDSTRFEMDQVGPIECKQCHRAAEEHALAQSRGKDQPVGVPTKLTPELSADVCGYCHLQGPARLLRDGRKWDDFQPGDTLGDSIAVFAYENPTIEFGIVGQAERLRRSRCATKDPRAGTCITCHTPHSQTPANPEHACATCHAANEHDCSGPKSPQCADCHMRRAQTQDIPHVSMTDHFIRRRPEAPPANKHRGALRWVNRPAGVPGAEAETLLGRAYAEVARTTGDSKARDTAIKHLEVGLKSWPHSPRGWFDLASMRRARGDVRGAHSAAESAYARSPDTPKFANAVAETRLAVGDLKGAQVAAEQATKLAPHLLDSRILQAKIAIARGTRANVVEAIEHVRRLRPDLGLAANLEGVWWLSRNDYTRAVEHFEAARKRTPHSIRYLQNMCRTLSLLQRWARIERECTLATEDAFLAGYLARAQLALGKNVMASQTALRGIRGGSPEATYVLGHLAMKANRLSEAAELLGRAAQANPDAREPLRDLLRVLTLLGQEKLAEAVQARLNALEGRTNKRTTP